MKLRNEDDLLDIGFRKKIIEEINGEENQNRIKECKKKYDIFKDGTKKYVLEQLSKELSPDTVQQMKCRTSDISILRKIIDKKSMVYKDGAYRQVNDDVKQSQLDFFVDELDINSKMKKVNKYVELAKNCCAYVLPYSDPLTGKKKINVRILLPYLYSVIEDSKNPEVPRVYILSFYNKKNSYQNYAQPNESGVRTKNNYGGSFSSGDGYDQIIADSPNDVGNSEEHIWWSTKFHFTTNGKGEIIEGLQEENLLNPIQRLPFVNFAKDQDGAFWAIGGDDLVNGSILINQLLSDMFFIAKMQGQGIFYLIGPKAPKSLKINANDAILMEKKEGDADTQIGFASSNPPLDSHMKMIEQYVALLLSTNNLEAGSIKGELTSTNAASGIQEIIRKSENIDDIQDQREIYLDNEPLLFDIIFRWHNLLLDRNLLDDEYKKIGKVVDLNFVLKFLETKVYMSEKEKLEIIKMRKDLGLDTLIDSLMRDNKDLTIEQARLKLKELIEEKLKEKSDSIKNNYKLMYENEEENEEEEDEEEKNEEEENKN